jgi:exopolysaccharide production protein ExoQ
MAPLDIPKKSRITLLTRPEVLLGLVVFLTPLLTLFVPLSLATLLPLLVLFAVICRVVSGAPRFRFGRMPAIVVAAIIIVAAASAGWSFSAELTWDKIPRTAVIAVVGVVLLAAMRGLEPAQGRTISKAFLAGIILVFVLIVAGRVVGEILIRTALMEGSILRFLNNFNRPLSLLSIMIWPAAVTLTDRRPAYGIAAVVACLALFATFQTAAATAAVAMGAIVFTGVYAAPRIMAPLTGTLLGIAVLLAPTIDHILPPPKAMFEQLSLPRSAYHRLLIWRFASEKIAERPFLGWGFNTSRAIPGGKENLDVSEAAMPLHPHNTALQWRLELGILGALLGAGLFFVATDIARRYGRNRIAQAGGVATVASAFCVAMLSFGAWQSWWLSGLFIIAGMTVLACRNPEKSSDA